MVKKVQKMKTMRDIFNRQIFKEFQRYNINYVLLHNMKQITGA